MRKFALLVIFIFSQNLICSSYNTRICLDSLLNYIVNQKEVISKHFELECQNKPLYKLNINTAFLEESDIVTKYHNIFGKIYGTKTKSELHFKYKEIYKKRKNSFNSVELPDSLNFYDDIISTNNKNQPLTIRIDIVSEFYFIANIEIHENNNCKLNPFRSIKVYLFICNNEFYYYIHKLVS